MNNSNTKHDVTKILYEIDKEFYLLNYNQPKRVDNILDEFLDLCKSKFIPISKRSNSNRIENPYKIIIMPVFHELGSWEPWKTKEISYYKYFSSFGAINYRIKIQTSLSIASNIRFTKMMLNYQNEEGKQIPKAIQFRLRDENNYLFEKSNTIFSFSNKAVTKFKKKHSVANFAIKKITSQSSINSKYVHLFEPKDIDPNIDIKTFEFSNTISNDFIKYILESAKQHSIYLDPGYKIYYFFSSSVAEYNSKQTLKQRGLGGLFILIKEDEIKDEIRFIDLFKRITDKLANRIIQNYQVKSILTNATRAAISQVMARNMSHNIGSHVLSNMVTETAVITNFKKDKNQYDSLYEVFYGKNSDEQDKKLNTEFILSNFNSYLRTRMDFLADIATGQPAMEVTKLFVRDIIGEIDKNRILLNHISGIDNFRYSLVIKDCRKCKLINCTNSECRCNGTDRDISVSIPNGIMGYHAIYILIENVIRNTAKHQSSKGISQENSTPSTSNSNNINLDKEFTLEITDSTEDNTLYEALIYDNVDIDEDIIIDEPFRQLYKANTGKVFLEDDSKFQTFLDRIVFEQNCRINTSVINSSSSRLREGAWGLIEMDASAAYLRKLPPENIDADIYDLDLLDEHKRTDVTNKHLNILKAVKKGNHLAYRFHLMKPKELLVVDENGEIYKKLKEEKIADKLKFDLLLENGIWVKQSTNPNGVDYFDINSVYAHPFMLVIAGSDFVEEKYLYVDGDVNKLFRGNLPSRIIFCSNTFIPKIKSPWRTYVNCDSDLIKCLLRSDKLVRKSITKQEDLEEEILMDLVWRIWLNNKMEFNQVGNISPEIATKLKLEINTNLNAINIHLAHHGTKSEFSCYSNNSNDFFLTYPSFVKDFIDASIMDMSQGNANSHYIKTNTAILSECIMIKILILDERVQSAWKLEDSSTKAIKQNLYSYCQLFCPTEDEINFNKPTFELDYKNKILGIINKLDSTYKTKGLDYIVIHLGVIEKILTASQTPKKEENVRQLILELQNKLNTETRIVITSGRGKPDNLPKEVPFISFSTLSQYCIETTFKPYLNQIIQNARIFKQN